MTLGIDGKNPCGVTTVVMYPQYIVVEPRYRQTTGFVNGRGGNATRLGHAYRHSTCTGR